MVTALGEVKYDVSFDASYVPHLSLLGVLSHPSP